MMIGFGAIFALVGIILFIAGAAQAGQNRSYAAASADTAGTVRKKRAVNKKNGKSYELTVSYTVNGKSYEKIVGALLSEYDTIAVGDKIPLKYQPDQPKKAVRPGNLNPKNVRVLLILGGLFVVVGVILFVIGRI